MKNSIHKILSAISRFSTKLNDVFSRPEVFISFIILFTLIRIILGIDRGIWANYSPHDDLLYLQLGRNIVNGEWLGPLNSLTLAKSCIYPGFIALSIWSGIPYLLVLDILICGTMYLCVQSLRPVLNRFWALLLYILLIFNPAFFLSQRLLVQDLLTILIAGQIFCLNACWLRRNQELKSSIPWIICSGFYFALAAHTREEGNVFIFVFIGIYFLLLIDAICRKHAAWESIIKAGLIYILIPIAVFFSIKLTISAVNKHHYGIFETCMRNTRSYKGFIGSLLGAAKQLDPDWDIRIPVRYEIWDKLFQISPTLKTLQPYIKPASWWHIAATSRFPEDVLKKTPALVNNTKGGFVQWEILDAMQQAGYFNGGNRLKSDKFFKDVVGELQQAAEKGTLPGFKPRYSNLVPWSRQMKDWFITKFCMDVRTLYHWESKFLDVPFIDLPHKKEEFFLIDYYFAAVRSPENLNRNYYVVTGWGFLPEDKQIIKLHNFSDSSVIYYQQVNRPDVQKFLVKKGYTKVPLDSGFQLLLGGNRIKVNDNFKRCILDEHILSKPKTDKIQIDGVTEFKALPSVRWKRLTLKKICRFFQITGKYFSFLAAVILIGGILSVFLKKRTLSEFLDLFLPGIILLGCAFIYFCLIIFANVMLHCPRYAMYYLPAFALLYSGCWAVIINGSDVIPVFFLLIRGKFIKHQDSK